MQKQAILNGDTLPHDTIAESEKESSATNDIHGTQPAVLPTVVKRRPDILVAMEGNDFSYEFYVRSICKLEFLLLMTLDHGAFRVKPKSQTAFTLTINGEIYNVIYMGNPEKLDDNYIMAFLLNLDDNDSKNR
jgi:hypothetical protein